MVELERTLSSSHGRLVAVVVVRRSFPSPEALTSSFRFDPSVFVLRPCYILRLDRLSRGCPDAEESRRSLTTGRYTCYPIVERRMTTSASISIGVGFDTARTDIMSRSCARICNRPPWRSPSPSRPRAMPNSARHSSSSKRNMETVHFSHTYRCRGSICRQPGTVPPGLALRENPLRRPAQAKSGLPQRAHFPKRKADAVESHACARFAMVEQPAPTPETPPEFAQLRESPPPWRARSSRPPAWSTSSTIVWPASFPNWRWWCPSVGGLGAAVARRSTPARPRSPPPSCPRSWPSRT